MAHNRRRGQQAFNKRRRALLLHSDHGCANVSTHTVKCRRSRCVPRWPAVRECQPVRVAVLATPAELQSQMPQKIEVIIQDCSELCEYVALHVTLAPADEAPPPGETLCSIGNRSWAAVSFNQLIWVPCMILRCSYHAELHLPAIFVPHLLHPCTLTMHLALHRVGSVESPDFLIHADVVVCARFNFAAALQLLKVEHFACKWAVLKYCKIRNLPRRGRWASILFEIWGPWSTLLMCSWDS